MAKSFPKPQGDVQDVPGIPEPQTTADIKADESKAPEAPAFDAGARVQHPPGQLAAMELLERFHQAIVGHPDIAIASIEASKAPPNQLSFPGTPIGLVRRTVIVIDHRDTVSGRLPVSTEDPAQSKFMQRWGSLLAGSPERQQVIDQENAASGSIPNPERRPAPWEQMLEERRKIWANQQAQALRNKEAQERRMREAAANQS